MAGWMNERMDEGMKEWIDDKLIYDKLTNSSER